MPNPLARGFTALHAKLVRASGRFGGGTGDGSLLVLRHAGAKSGIVRETPLAFFNHPDGFVVVASMGGAPTNPGWYHNLIKNPDTIVTVDRTEIHVRARLLEGADREAMWAKIKGANPRWARYEQKTDRVMPIMLLQRV